MSAFPVAVGSGSVGSKLGRCPVKHPPSTTPASTTPTKPVTIPRLRRVSGGTGLRNRDTNVGIGAAGMLSGRERGGEGSAATAAMAASGYGVTLLERDPPRR